MTEYNIKYIGKADVGRRSIICNFNISSKEFFKKFADHKPDRTIKGILKEAIDKPGSEIKVGRGDKGDLEAYLEKISAAAEDLPKSQLGFSADEQSEAMAAERIKMQDGQSETITYHDQDPSTAGIETYDSETGQKEGEIFLGPQGNTGKLVPLKIIEKVETHFKFNEEEDIEEERTTSGEFIIQNPSESHKIWDVDIKFEKDKSASIEEAIHINSIPPNGEEKVEYELEEFEEPALKIHEFISTMNDQELETYALSLDSDNVVLFKLKVTNIRDYAVKDITINKEIIDGYSNVDILETSHGDANTDDGIVWKIESLEPNEEASISLNMTIEIPDRDYKPKTGKVSAEYFADHALTGIKIENFDAYSDNFVAVEQNQLEDDPEKYACRVWFENESDFQVQVVNLDIIDPNTNEKVLDIDPSEIPPIAAGATWKSVSWLSDAVEGKEPKFHKTVEFFLIGHREISTMGLIHIDDIELAVAMIDRKLDYSVKSLASFRLTPFNVLHQVKNTGGADLNELVLEEVIQTGYIPPSPENIKLYIVRPQDDDDISEGFNEEEEIDWEDLGDDITLAEEMIEIEPSDPEAEGEHIVRIKLEDLRESSIGMITPGTIIRVTYEIQANKPERDTEYISNVKYITNTFPAGAPIEAIPEEIRIPVVHRRIKKLSGKKVRALETEGQYEITLTFRNMGEDPIENIQIRDVVPDNFEYGDYSQDPSKFDNLEDKDLLIWNIEEIEANGKISITYIIRGVGDEYKASDAQFSV